MRGGGTRLGYFSKSSKSIEFENSVSHRRSRLRLPLPDVIFAPSRILLRAVIKCCRCDRTRSVSSNVKARDRVVIEQSRFVDTLDIRFEYHFRQK